MNLPSFLGGVTPNEDNEAFFRLWPETQAARPQGEIEFLRGDHVRRWCDFVGIPSEATSQVLEAAELVRQDAELNALAWHCHALLFGSLPSSPGRATRPADWPTKDRLGEVEGRFNVLIVLSGLPSLVERYRERSIPGNVVSDTLSDIWRWMDHNRRKIGSIGLGLNNVQWLLNHLRGGIYHLGRLQFQPGRFRGKVRAFRNKADRSVIALSEGGVTFRPDGRVVGTGNVYDPSEPSEDELYVSSLNEEARHEGAEAVEGVPIDPGGFAVLKPVALKRSEWDIILSPGDPVLHLHVPEGEPLDFARCGQSFDLALEFFPRYFPDTPFRAFCMGSWFLDPEFQKLLSPESNIVRFQKEVYLYPAASSGRSVLERVFGDVPDDIRSSPQDTSLRSAIVRHLSSGGRLGGGACFLLVEDLRWGAQVYAKRAM